MDYDDNDFQGQNIHLAGEGSSKNSPVLHPYALSKFDFDDGLQGHLRFDSLVENEVFLGIPSQEDNHWIEDFSRGSSGIEFNSSAAETCSISRRNNVWSEATSSESVEMLLKSVGQEEIVCGETIVEESDACHELGLSEQMEPHMKQDEKVMDLMDSNPILPSDVLPEHLTRLNDVKGSSQIQEAEISTHGSSHVLDPNVSTETCGVFVTENNPGVSEKCDQENQIEVDTSVNEYLNDRMQKDSSGSGMQIDDIGSSSQDNAASVGVLNNQESENQVSDVRFGTAECLLTDTGEAVGEHHVPGKEVDPVDQTLEGIAVETGPHNLDNLSSSSSKVEPTEQHTVENGISNFEKPSSLPLRGDCNLQIVEECEADLCSSDPNTGSKYKPVDLSNSTVVHQQFRGNMNQTTHGENSAVEGKDQLLGSHHRSDTEASVSNSEASLLSGIDNNKVIDGQGDGSNNNYVGDHCSVTEFHGQKRTTEDLDVADDASGVLKEDLNARDHVSVNMVAGSMRTFEGNLVSNPNEVHSDQDVSFNEKEKANLPNESSNMEVAIVESLGSDRRVEPSSQGEGQVTDHLDNNKRTEDEGPTEANLPILKDSSERSSKLVAVLELDKGASVKTINVASGSEQAGEVLHKEVDQSSPLAEATSVVFQGEHAVKANEICENSSNQLEVCHTLCDSTVKQDGVPEGVVPGNHEEATVAKNREVASSKDADSDKSNCGTPNAITVLSQNEKDKKKIGVNESICKSSIPVYEVTVQSGPQNASGNVATKDEGSFTFEVKPSAGLSERETTKDSQSFPTIQACNIVKGSPSAPAVGEMDSKTIPELPRESSQAADKEIASGGSKVTAERKRRRASGSASEKENARRRKEKDTTSSRQSQRGLKSHRVSMNLSGTSQLVQFEGLKPHGNVERSGTIPCGVVSIPTSNFVDLNTSSAPPSALFPQPFTDLQQVQLRAQIFVYGSLIQRAAPEEACMVSAFGASDGGRSVWEPVWRACVERLQGQKSHPDKFENPVQPRSGAKPPDQSIKQGSLQSQVLPSPVGQASSKATPSPVVSSMIPLSSPLWNLSTPSCGGLQSSGMPRSGLLDYHQTPSPLHSFQTPPTGSFVGFNTSWLSQGPFPLPRLASPHTTVFDASARVSVLPMTETVKLTPVKESSAPFSSGLKNASHSTVVHSTGPSVFAGSPSLPDMKKVTVTPAQNFTDPKTTRKRKKVTVSGDLSQISLLAHTHTESVSVPLVTSQLSTSVVVSTPACFVPKGNDSNIVTAVPPTFSTDPPKSGEQNAEQKATLSEDTFNKVEAAKRHAEDAAALAAAAVSQSQNVWSQLDKQKSSGLIPDVEAKLAAAAVAIAAAASVAKAAAAAANIASNAALQAKLMADEALISSVTSYPAQSYAAAFPDFVNLGKATPASILKGGDGSNSSNSILVAAREAARRRLEAASAASKHAENLDAIVKAAELAAEAVSQAGKIVAMGNPFPLNELVKAGPEGYWRVPEVSPQQGDDIRERSKLDISDGLNFTDRHAKEGPFEKQANTTNHDVSPPSREFSKQSVEDPMRVVDGVSSSFPSSEKDSRGLRSRRASDLGKTIGVVPESEIGSRSASISAQEEYEQGVGTLEENNIKEGCRVEVYKGGHKFKAAWYSANVLSLKDGKAFVVYSDLQSDDGSSQLKEWVTLEGEGNSAPRIRIDRHVATMRSEGTRKRRRAARGDYVWSVGDRVDAWIQDCWREGVVTEKKNKDDATVTVDFPAEGERSVVRAWDLQPTLIWKDGEWIEWSSSGEREPSSQGDTPQEKRLKLGNPAIEGREKDNSSKNMDHVKSKGTAESQSLPLSANEKTFHVGKNTRTEIKPEAPRTVRSGLQKEGSRVVFGVPKPGKKRKFMDVSKHYVAEKSTKTNEPNDSIKLANYLMPQGSGSRGWKNTKIYTKEKQPAESKPKVLNSGKMQSSRSLPQKDNFLTSAQNKGTETDHVIQDSVGTNKNVSRQQNVMEFGSFSSLALPSHAPKKIPTSRAKSERVNTEKPAPSTGKWGKFEVKDKHSHSNSGQSVPDVTEPRRSNRRIQPTSRLLEGLQSSLMITKIPAVSHDKGPRSQNRGSSKGNNHG